MAEHKKFTVDTGVAVYFCDPKSPWQRGTNENLNGLLRQYIPQGTCLRPYSQQDLNEIAAKLNTRPPETPGFRTSARKFADLLHYPLSPPALALVPSSRISHRPAPARMAIRDVRSV